MSRIIAATIAAATVTVAVVALMPAPARAGQGVPIAGDWNGVAADWTPLGSSSAGGSVDHQDYQVFQGGWGSPGNGDGVVDGADFTIWQRNVGAAEPMRVR